jgi:hypothetical protein
MHHYTALGIRMLGDSADEYCALPCVSLSLYSVSIQHNPQLRGSVGAFHEHDLVCKLLRFKQQREMRQCSGLS